MRTLILATLAVVLVFCASASAEDCPVYSEASKTVVYQEMSSRMLVRDTYIGQDGCKLSLAIIVGHSASQTYAKEQGDSMVRLTKSFGQGPSPQKQVGKGIYDFLVGIYRPDKTQVALGAKSRYRRSIRW